MEDQIFSINVNGTDYEVRVEVPEGDRTEAKYHIYTDDRQAGTLLPVADEAVALRWIGEGNLDPDTVYSLGRTIERYYS